MRFEVYEELTATQYASLLNFAQALGGSFSLVWQDQLEFHSLAEVECELEPSLIRAERTSTWPGTCSSGIATVRFYRINDDSLRVLRGAGAALAWCAPERPEDLALYEPDGRCWLESIAHEGDIMIDLSEAQYRCLQTAVTGLKVYILAGSSDLPA